MELAILSTYTCLLICHLPILLCQFRLKIRYSSGLFATLLTEFHSKAQSSMKNLSLPLCQNQNLLLLQNQSHISHQLILGSYLDLIAEVYSYSLRTFPNRVKCVQFWLPNNLQLKLSWISLSHSMSYDVYYMTVTPIILFLCLFHFICSSLVNVIWIFAVYLAFQLIT